MTVNVIKYSLKVWLTSVCGAPALHLIVLFFWESSYKSNIPDLFPMTLFIYIGMVLAQLAFSFFIWVLFALLILIIVKISASGMIKTIIIFSIGILLACAPFFAAIISLDFTTGDAGIALVLMACNCACIGFGVWFYKLKLPQPDLASPNPENI